MNATLSNLLWLEGVSAPDKAMLRKQMTVNPRGFEGESPEPICLVQEDCGRIGLPLMAGLKFFQTRGGYATLAAAFKDVDNRSSEGHDISRFIRRRPAPRDQRQTTFFEELPREVGRRIAVFAEAPTGSGKSIAALNAIALLGCSALVVVPRKRIAAQWRKMAIDFLGLPPSRIGMIEEGKFDFRHKAITVAVIHNLVGREIPEGFAEAFGTVVFDEVQNLGARSFSESMGRVYARYRFGLTATPERGDGCESLYFDYFGRPSVIYPGEALAATCRVFDFFWSFQKKVGKRGRVTNDINRKPRAILKKILISSGRRNKMIAGMIKKLYDAGRHILVIGDEILHLQVLMGMVSEEGVPADDCGLYTGSYVDVEGKQKKMNDEQLDWVRDHSRVIFASYGMASEALDIPRLDSGIDVTPHSKGIQMIGRIRRNMPNKPTPLWLTIRDRGIRIFEQACASRLREFRENNVTVIEHGQKTKTQNQSGSATAEEKVA